MPLPPLDPEEIYGNAHQNPEHYLVAQEIPLYMPTTNPVDIVQGGTSADNTTTARSNLGLGSVATHSASEFLTVANNLSDVNNAATSRTNLGLGSSATHPTTDFAAASHTHSASDITSGTKTSSFISDFTSAARGSISVSGAGGSYNSSTGVITIGGLTPSFNNAPSHSIVTTAAAANGFQLSTTRNASVSYSTTILTTVSLSGNASGYVALEIAATNSSTASDWMEIARVSSGQSGTLVVGLTLNQTGGGVVSGMVPAGYYARLRSVNVSGTPTYSYSSGQEVLL